MQGGDILWEMPHGSLPDSQAEHIGFVNNMLWKPVIILSAPRSGSTLLFEIFSSAKGMWTIGDESHAAIESIPELQIQANSLSNRLTESRATPEIIRTLHHSFLLQLRDRDNIPANLSTNAKYRFLEKTPKNALRVPFLHKAFPDATYIYLVRDPREAISSIMEAWRVGRWVTYANLPGWQGNWSLLLPPDWKKYANKRLEDVAAFQWKSANQYIIDDLSKIPDAKVVTVSYTELVNDTYNQIKRICNECDITFDERLETLTKGILPHSKYTQTAPAQDKWKKNRNEIDRIQPGLNGIIKKISKALLRNRGQQIDWCTSGAVERVSRNSQCPCGSGRKYKQCHGRQ